MTTHPALPLAFTMGDAAGIGPEIIVKLFDGQLNYPAVVYGDPGTLERTIFQLGLQARLQVWPGKKPLASPQAGLIPVISRTSPLPLLPQGKLTLTLDAPPTSTCAMPLMMHKQANYAPSSRLP